MDNYEEVTKILLLEALKSAEMSMPETQSEETETLQTACQEKDARIRDLECLQKAAREGFSKQAVLIKKLEEAFLKAYYAQIYHGSLRFGIQYTEEEMQAKAKEALEKIEEVDRKL